MLYTVVKGDNLTKIAKKYGTTINAIVATNGLADANKIYVGQSLKIPEKAPTAPAQSLKAEFLAYLEKQVGHIYVWGAQGKNLTELERKKSNPEQWIKNRETSNTNANRAIALYRKKKAAGVDPILAYDCSGLVMYFLQNMKGVIGVDLSAASIYSKCEKLGRDDLEPGDFVFRHNGKTVHHIGVYVGGGKVIESMGRDVGVVKRSIDASGSKYWNRYGRLEALQK